jgi:hypothetical protein
LDFQQAFKGLELIGTKILGFSETAGNKQDRMTAEFESQLEFFESGSWVSALAWV